MKFWTIQVAPEDEATKDRVVAYLRRLGLVVDVEENDTEQCEATPQYRY